jgi:hypothetical protein
MGDLLFNHILDYSFFGYSGRTVYLFQILMKKFIFKGILFVVFFLILDTLFYSIISMLFQKTDFIYNKVLVEKPEILFFGDSRFKHGIVPRILSQSTGMSSYNISQYGSGIMYSKGLTPLIFSHYHPKLIIIQVMPIDRDRGALHELAPYFNNKTVKHNLIYYPYNIRFKYMSCKTIQYNGAFLPAIYKLFVKDADPFDGYAPFFTSTPGINRLVLGEKNKTPRIKFIVPGEKLLVEMVREAKNNTSIVVIVEMPTSTGQREKSSLAYRKIAKEYKIPYLDFQEENKPWQLNDDCFYDMTHLNDKGAQIFTNILSEEIVKLINNALPGYQETSE